MAAGCGHGLSSSPVLSHVYGSSLSSSQVLAVSCSSPACSSFPPRTLPLCPRGPCSCLHLWLCLWLQGKSNQSFTHPPPQGPGSLSPSPEEALHHPFPPTGLRGSIALQPSNTQGTCPLPPSRALPLHRETETQMPQFCLLRKQDSHRRPAVLPQLHHAGASLTCDSASPAKVARPCLVGPGKAFPLEGSSTEPLDSLPPSAGQWHTGQATVNTLAALGPDTVQAWVLPSQVCRPPSPQPMTCQPGTWRSQPPPPTQAGGSCPGEQMPVSCSLVFQREGWLKRVLRPCSCHQLDNSPRGALSISGHPYHEQGKLGAWRGQCHPFRPAWSRGKPLPAEQLRGCVQLASPWKRLFALGTKQALQTGLQKASGRRGRATV